MDLQTLKTVLLKTVTVTGGYLKVSEYFNADITSDKQSVGNCNR